MLGILTASFIGSIGCGIWLLLSKGAAKFYVRDAMKYLRLVLLCFVLPIIPFVVYPCLKSWGLTISGPYMLKPMVNVLMAVMGVWAIFVVGMMIRRFINYLIVCRLCKDSIPIEDEDILRQIDNWKKALQIKRRVRVFLNPNVTSPALLFHWGYQILLPAYEMTEQEINMAMLHELVHLKHNDILVKDACFAVNVIHGMNPITKFIKTHIVKWAEVLCDLTTCEVGKNNFSRQEYYYGIIDLMKNAEEEMKNDAIFSLSESKSLLEFRVDKFAEANKEKQHSLRGVLYIVLFLMVTVTSMVLGITVRATNVWYEATLSGLETEEYQVMREEYRTVSYDEIFGNQELIYTERYSFAESLDDRKTLKKGEIWCIHVEKKDVEDLNLHIFTDSTDYTIGCVNGAKEVVWLDGEGVISHGFHEEQDIKQLFIKNNGETREFDIAAVVLED